MGLISFSIFTGSVSWVIPRRLTKRLTWVSTGKPGRPSATLRTTLAVFLPTPGRLTRSDIDSGTDPPNSVINFWPFLVNFLPWTDTSRSFLHIPLCPVFLLLLKLQGLDIS